MGIASNKFSCSHIKFWKLFPIWLSGCPSSLKNIGSNFQPAQRTIYQGFQIRTGPYGPTGKTVNLSQSRFFMLKNRSMSKKQGTVWIAVQPHGFENRNQTVSHGSLWIWTYKKKKKKKKNTEKQKKKKHNSLSRETQKHNSLSKETQKQNSLSKEKKKKYIMSAIAISRETQHVFMFLLLLSSGHITQLPLFRNSSLGRSKL